MIAIDHGTEWRESDGLGRFASGTTAGVSTRRYHAFLLAAPSPPDDRHVLVNDAVVWLETPRAKRHVLRFDLSDPVADWIVALDIPAVAAMVGRQPARARVRDARARVSPALGASLAERPSPEPDSRRALEWRRLRRAVPAGNGSVPAPPRASGPQPAHEHGRSDHGPRDDRQTMTEGHV